MGRAKVYFGTVILFATCLFFIAIGEVRLGTLTPIVLIGGGVLGLCAYCSSNAVWTLAEKLGRVEAADDAELKHFLAPLNRVELFFLAGFEAFGEEILFRGMLWQILIMLFPNRVAIWLITSLIFGLCHGGGPLRRISCVINGCLYGLPILLGWPLWTTAIAHTTRNCLLYLPSLVNTLAERAPNKGDAS